MATRLDILKLEMMHECCAWHYKHFDKTPAYAEAEREAKSGRIM